MGEERESLVSTVCTCAYISQKSWEIRNYCVISVQPWRHNVYFKLLLHCPHTFWQTMEAFRSFVLLCTPTPSSSLRWLSTSYMSLKKVQVATSFFWLEKYGYYLVSRYDTTVLPFVIDCKLAKKGTVVQAVVWWFCSSLHATILVYLLNCTSQYQSHG